MWEPVAGVDMPEWHVYTILWEPGNGTFLVDGRRVASLGNAPSSSMTTIVWTDNTVCFGPRLWDGANWGSVDVRFNEHIQVDYVRVFGIPERILLCVLGLLVLPALRGSREKR